MKANLTLKRLSSFVLATCMLQACATTPDLSAGNPLPGIGLEASGNSVLLSWAEDGPLGQLLRTNSNVQLVASYPSESGNVSGEPISSARVGAIYSGVKFDLPDNLRNIATGPVCFRITHNRRSIPVRIARPGESSDGFYYNEWVEISNKSRSLKVLEKDKTTIDRNVENFRAGDTDFITWRDRSGLSMRSDCDNIVVETSTERPKDALQGAQKVVAAKQQCVALFYKIPTKRFFNDADPLATQRPGLTALLLAQEIRSKIPSSSKFSIVANQLVTDLQSYGSGRALFKVAELPLLKSTELSLFTDVEDGLSESDAVSLAEAYAGCLNETENRIDLSYQSWQSSRDPALKAKLTKTRRQECRTRFDSYQQKEDRLQHWLDQQAEIDAQIARLKSASETSLPSRRPLIPYSCPF